MAKTKLQTPVAFARRLNEQHAAYSAGFYAHIPACNAARFFAARVRTATLQVTPDFGDTWIDVPPGTIFGDHNGRNILTTA